MSTDFDVIIVGGGPTGLASAVYTGRALLKTLVLERQVPGGQIALTSAIDNYPGFADGITGYEFAQAFLRHAQRFGAEIRIGTGAERITPEADGTFTVGLSDGSSVTAQVVILAMGRHPRMLDVPNEKRLVGYGVSYCATCDGAFFRDVPVAVVGGGNSAVEEGHFLTRYASAIKAIHRRDRFTAQKILIEQYTHDSKVEPVFRARGENPIRFIDSLFDKVLDQNADVRLFSPEPQRFTLLRVERCINPGEQTLTTRFLIARRAIDLARMKEAWHSTRLEIRSQLTRIDEVVFDCVARSNDPRLL